MNKIGSRSSSMFNSKKNTSPICSFNSTLTIHLRDLILIQKQLVESTTAIVDTLTETATPSSKTQAQQLAITKLELFVENSKSACCSFIQNLKREVEQEVGVKKQNIRISNFLHQNRSSLTSSKETGGRLTGVTNTLLDLRLQQIKEASESISRMSRESVYNIQRQIWQDIELISSTMVPKYGPGYSMALEQALLKKIGGFAEHKAGQPLTSWSSNFGKRRGSGKMSTTPTTTSFQGGSVSVPELPLARIDDSGLNQIQNIKVRNQKLRLEIIRGQKWHARKFKIYVF